MDYKEIMPNRSLSNTPSRKIQEFQRLAHLQPGRHCRFPPVFRPKTRHRNVIQWSPLVWSTDVRSTRLHLYGQFLAGPEQNGHFVSGKAPLKVRKSRLYGQF